MESIPGFEPLGLMGMFVEAVYCTSFVSGGEQQFLAAALLN